MQKSYWIVLLIVFSQTAFAETNRDFFVQEHQKEILQGKSPQDARSEQEAYKNELELISSQLEVITGDEETRYIVVPGDELTIAYTDRNTEKKAVYQVSSTGEIHMPLIGAVKVGGFNRKQIREILDQAMGEFIRYPNVNLTVNTTGRYMIVGAVKGPGVYWIHPNLSLMEAILGAGYNKDSANLKSIMVMRGGLEKPVVLRMNLKKMFKNGDRSDNVVLKPGDFVFVPTTFISDLDEVKNRVYGHILTYYGIGGQSIVSGYRGNP